MQHCNCDSCQTTVPFNDSVIILGESLCLDCARKMVDKNADLTEEDVIRNLDLTVCVNCGKDGGLQKMEQIIELPLCRTCLPIIANRPFPRWIKVSALALAALVVLSFMTNLRFVQAYFELEKVDSAIEAGDAQAAADLFVLAATHVPEAVDLEIMSSYWQGVALLDADRPDEAIEHLSRCLDDLPPDFQVAEMISSAKSGAAFDRRDYREFLRLVEIRAEENPGDLSARLSVASALACLYIDTGDASYANKAEAIIGTIPETDMDAGGEEYIMRIRHRLETRTIIGPQEFFAQYPNGWYASGEAQ